MQIGTCYLRLRWQSLRRTSFMHGNCSKWIFVEGNHSEIMTKFFFGWLEQILFNCLTRRTGSIRKRCRQGHHQEAERGGEAVLSGSTDSQLPLLLEERDSLAVQGRALVVLPRRAHAPDPLGSKRRDLLGSGSHPRGQVRKLAEGRQGLEHLQKQVQTPHYYIFHVTAILNFTINQL